MGVTVAFPFTDKFLLFHGMIDGKKGGQVLCVRTYVQTWHISMWRSVG